MQTVKKCCDGTTNLEVLKDYERQHRVITSVIEDFILDRFKADELMMVKKHNHTAKRIYDRLVGKQELNGYF